MYGSDDQPGTRDAIVVGGGFCGVAVLHLLAQRGLDVQMLEAGSDVGGVWHWNRYPGVRCDIETFEYSYAFPEIEDAWEWSHRLATGEQLQAHISFAVDRFGLRDRIAFGARVESAIYDEDAHRWTLTAQDGRSFTATSVIWATGVPSATQMPSIPGVTDFQGLAVHTADWPDDGVDVAGKRVGVIGTGSSGVQIIPPLAEDAGQLVVFQRTANHVVPAGQRPITPEERAELRATVTERRAAARDSVAGMSLAASEKSVFDADEDERRETFQQYWDEGGFSLLRAFRDVGSDLEAATIADAFVRDKIREAVDDPEVAEKLMPADHPINTKRLGVGIGYYEAFNRDNVRLVDARTEGIARITPGGVELTTGEEIALDVLVFATGFDSFTGAMRRVEIRGPDGLTIQSKWADGARTYMGLGVAGFPNMFMVGGPGSPSIFSNAPITAEFAGGWIGDLLLHQQAEGIAEIEPEAEAEAAWTDHLIEVAEGTLFRHLRTTWYHGANTPGKKPLFMGYTGGVNVYHARLGEIREGGYEGFALRRHVSR